MYIFYPLAVTTIKFCIRMTMSMMVTLKGMLTSVDNFLPVQVICLHPSPHSIQPSKFSQIVTLFHQIKVECHFSLLAITDQQACHHQGCSGFSSPSPSQSFVPRTRIRKEYTECNKSASEIEKSHLGRQLPQIPQMVVNLRKVLLYSLPLLIIN